MAKVGENDKIPIGKDKVSAFKNFIPRVVPVVPQSLPRDVNFRGIPILNANPILASVVVPFPLVPVRPEKRHGVAKGRPWEVRKREG